MLKALFGRKRYMDKPLDYSSAQVFNDYPAGLVSPNNRGLPMTAFVGGTGILVDGTINAVNPAVIIPENNQVIASVYGEGYYPTYLPVQQTLSQQRRTGAL